MFQILLVAVVGFALLLMSPALTQADEPNLEVTLDGAAVARTWTDHTGTRHVIATFLDADRQNVRLQKSSGARISVPLAKLSSSDRDWISAQTLLAASATRTPDDWFARAWKSTGISELPRHVTWLFTPSDEWREILSDVQANAVHIQVSEKFLNSLIPNTHSHHTQIQDVILGAQVRGQGHANSALRLDLVPSANHAVSDLLVTGRCNSQTTSYSAPVQIHGHTVTVFSARKRFVAGDDQIKVLPAVSAARSYGVTDSITSSLPRLRGRISVRIAEQEVASRRGQVDYISARHAEQRVNRKVDELVGHSFDRMPEVLRIALTKGKSNLPMRLVSRSTGDRLQVSLLPKDKSLGDAMPVPPTIESTADIVVQIHAPLLNRALSRVDLKDAVRRVLAQTAKARLMQLVSTRDSTAPHWTLRWSGDHRWVTFSWSEKPAVGSVEDKVAAAPY